MIISYLGALFALVGILGLWVTLEGYYDCPYVAGKRAMIPAMASCAGWAVLGTDAALAARVDQTALVGLILYTTGACIILYLDLRRTHEVI